MSPTDTAAKAVCDLHRTEYLRETDRREWVNVEGSPLPQHRTGRESHVGSVEWQ
jgi:hypothetical protein